MGSQSQQQKFLHGLSVTQEGGEGRLSMHLIYLRGSFTHPCINFLLMHSRHRYIINDIVKASTPDVTNMYLLFQYN